MFSRVVIGGSAVPVRLGFILLPGSEMIVLPMADVEALGCNLSCPRRRLDLHSSAKQTLGDCGLYEIPN
jgi:hypothetical protein